MALETASTTFVALGLENWLDVTVYGLQCAAIGVWLHVYVADGGGLAAKIAPPVAFDGIYVAPLATIDVLAMDAGAQADVERFLLALNDVAEAQSALDAVVQVRHDEWKGCFPVPRSSPHVPCCLLFFSSFPFRLLFCGQTFSFVPNVRRCLNCLFF